MTIEQRSSSGLEGTCVAHTALSAVEGERGRLVIAGHDVEAWALGARFESVCESLWGEGSPEALGEARARAYALLPTLGAALYAPDGMDALRGSVGQLPGSMDDPVGLSASVAVFAAAWSRLHRGLATVAPDPRAGHAEDYLHMLRDEPSSAAETAAMDTYLVTVSDHGMNASTFTARVVTSTGSDMVSAVTAALGALKGPLHGGAPGPVLDMLDAIGSPECAEAWLESELAAGRRIMGMGHRIYRVRDPRAAVFERALERLCTLGVSSQRLSLARAVEKAAEGALRARRPERPLHANVEFYTAVLLDTLRLPRQAFSPSFAVGRVAGWCAHVREQRAVGRLIRPESRYVGLAPTEVVQG